MFKNATIALGNGEVILYEAETNDDPIYKATKKSAEMHVKRMMQNA